MLCYLTPIDFLKTKCVSRLFKEKINKFTSLIILSLIKYQENSKYYYYVQNLIDIIQLFSVYIIDNPTNNKIFKFFQIINDQNRKECLNKIIIKLIPYFYNDIIMLLYNQLKYLLINQINNTI